MIFSSNDLYPLPDSGGVQEQPETEHHGYQPSQVCEFSAICPFVYIIITRALKCKPSAGDVTRL